MKISGKINQIETEGKGENAYMNVVDGGSTHVGVWTFNGGSRVNALIRNGGIVYFMQFINEEALKDYLCGLPYREKAVVQIITDDGIENMETKWTS